jgi:hypothetical protein
MSAAQKEAPGALQGAAGAGDFGTESSCDCITSGGQATQVLRLEGPAEAGASTFKAPSKLKVRLFWLAALLLGLGL